MLEKGTLQIRNYLFYGRDQRNNLMTLPVSLEWWVVMSGWQWVDNIVYVVVQFYPRCKFHFPLFCDMVIMYMYDNEFIKNKGKKITPREKLNHNIYSRFANTSVINTTS